MSVSAFDFQSRMAHYLAKEAVSPERRREMDEHHRMMDAVWAGDPEAIARWNAYRERIRVAFEARPKRRLTPAERRTIRKVGGCRRGCRVSAWLYLDAGPNGLDIRGTHNGVEFTLSGVGYMSPRDELKDTFGEQHNGGRGDE